MKPEHAWAVINAYFEEKGLVRQQLDSFDDFVKISMQEIIDQTPPIEMVVEPQHLPGDEDSMLRKRCVFSRSVSCVL